MISTFAPTIIERLLSSLLFIAGFAVLVKSFGLFRQWSAKRHSLAHILPSGMKISEPTLLYFWSAGCAQCTPQERQIGQAQAVLFDEGRSINVMKVNALEDRTLAEEMNVMTVPTTVLVDARGNVKAWNPGLTQSRTIIDQALAL